MDTLRDYLNPERIYMDRHNIHVGLELGDNGEVIRVNPAVKDSLTTEDEVAYATPICSGKSSETAPVRENLTTENVESAKMSRERAAEVLEGELMTNIIHYDSESDLQDALRVAIRALRDGV